MRYYMCETLLWHSFNDWYTLMINLISFFCIFNFFLFLHASLFQLLFFSLPTQRELELPTQFPFPDTRAHSCPGPGIRRCHMLDDSKTSLWLDSSFGCRKPMLGCLFGASSWILQSFLNSNSFKIKLGVFLPKFSSRITVHPFSKAEMWTSYQILSLLSFLICSCSSDSCRFYPLDVASPQFISCFRIPLLSAGLGSHCFLSGYFDGLLTAHFPGPTTVFSN